MRYFIVYFFASCFPLGGICQSAFNDAKELLPYAKALSSGKVEIIVDSTNNNQLKSILSNYVGDGEDISTTINDVDENPFIRINGTIQDNPGFIATTVGQGFKYLGGLDVTNFADGLARFMVKRTKEELSVVFFEQFKDELNRQKDLQLLFPSTFSILQTASSEIYNYQKFLPALREAFEYDLDEFLTNTYDWSISSDSTLKLLNELKKKVKLHNAVKLIFYTGRELDHGKHPGDILSEIPEQSEINLEALDINLRSYFEVADLFSQSLRSNAEGRYWISKNDIVQFRDKKFIKIYLGLLYQKCPPDLSFIVGGAPKPFREILKDLANTLNNVEAFTKQFATAAAQLEDGINKIGNKSIEIKGSDYVAISIDLFGLVQHVISTPIIKTIKPGNEALSQLKFYSRHASFLFAYIQSRAYNAAVYEAYAILDSALVNYSGRGKVLQPFLKYGTFIASVSAAESSEEVSNAIEAVALPTGSARIKREVAWNVSLNGYMGFFYGTENIPLSTGAANKAKALGVFAPVGIAVSRGFHIGKSNFSASIFGSLIDIGALASYRLKDDELETVPEIKLENIVSPGAYFILGLPKIPISIGYGYQIGPRLREVTATSNTTVENKYERWAGFIAVDIPLINFYSKPRK